jgi:phage terminase large subunit-like protein
MPGSIDDLETLILEGRLRVHVNPALRAAVSSATFDRSPADLRRFTKHKATARIDMAVALAMAVGAATARDFEASSPTPWDVDPEYTLVV